MPNFELHNGDCLKVMKGFDDNSVDAVVTDPPYGTTACKWDSVIPFAPMWEQLKRIIKPNGAIVLFASQPFTSTLICSNLKMFKYCWVWEKSKVTNHLNAKHQPMKKTEDITIFCSGKSQYYPQGLIPCIKICEEHSERQSDNYGDVKIGKYTQLHTNNPSNIIKVNSEHNTVHPTQKPVALIEYLIKTYTNKGETVLDFTMGSGTTGVACNNTERDFIGIELDAEYFAIAKARIEDAQKQGVQTELF